MGAFCSNTVESSLLYFSLGEAIAALSITLIIPQFIKPIYLFRLRAHRIGLTALYILVFLACIFALLGALSSPSGVSGIPPCSKFWEMGAFILFLLALAVLAYSYLRPANISYIGYVRFARSAADLLAHAEDADRADFCADLLLNINKLIKASQFSEIERRDRSAFYFFAYRRKLKDASYASSLLNLLSEPLFCSTIIHRSPWATAQILRKISDHQLHSQPAERFVQEIGRQAIVSQASMMSREIGYKGFRSAPVLTEALFRDPYLNGMYEPIAGLEYGDFDSVNKDVVDRFNIAAKECVKFSAQHGFRRRSRALLNLADHYKEITADVGRQVRRDRERYDVIVSLHFGVAAIVKEIHKALDEMADEDRGMLYASGELDKRDFSALDDLAETVVEIVLTFSNDFTGHDDPFWSTALDLIDSVFWRWGRKTEGMNPFQQRVSLKFVRNVRHCIEGLFPRVTRVLLSVLDPFDVKTIESRLPYHLFTRAIYFELKKFPELYSRSPDEAVLYLPPQVDYDDEGKRLIRRYRRGEEIATELGKLPDEPISLAGDEIR